VVVNMGLDTLNLRMNLRMRWCPRCRLEGLSPRRGYAWSRVTRDGGARIDVCDDCGEREAERDFARMPQIGFDDWPVSVDEILREDQIRYVRTRQAADSDITRERDES
jgi:hypothetical protein